jgi:hypothetical protein
MTLMMIIEVEVDSRRWRGLALFLDVRQRMPSLADPRALCMGAVRNLTHCYFIGKKQ